MTAACYPGSVILDEDGRVITIDEHVSYVIAQLEEREL